VVIIFGSFYLTIIYAILLTFGRIGLVLIISVFLALIFGVLSAKVRAAEAIIIPITDVLEAVPVVSFFPIILVFFIVRIGGPFGTEIAVDFLLVTAVLWNLILGVYQSVLHIPKEYESVAKVYKIGILGKLRRLYAPAAFPSIVANIMPSFASALFYITLTEVITIGNKNYEVFGVGTLSVQLANASNYTGIVIVIMFLIVAIGLTFYFFINPLIKMSEKYKFESNMPASSKDSQRRQNAFVTVIGERINQVIGSTEAAIAVVNRSIPRRDNVSRKQIKFSDRVINIIVGTTLVAVLLITLYFVAESGFSSAFTEYILNPHYLKIFGIATLYDLARIGIVFAISLGTMVPLAVFFGRRKVSGRFSTGIFQILYSIPSPVLLPLIIIFLTPKLAVFLGEGLAFNADVMIIAYLSAASYIFFNVYGSAISIPNELDVIAKTYKLSRWMKIRYLSFPAIIPGLITGSMSAVGSYWGGLLVAEYVTFNGKTFAVKHGLMLLISKAIANGNLLYADAIDIFMVIIVVILTFVVWVRLYRYSEKRFTYD